MPQGNGFAVRGKRRALRERMLDVRRWFRRMRVGRNHGRGTREMLYHHRALRWPFAMLVSSLKRRVKLLPQDVCGNVAFFSLCSSPFLGRVI